MKVGTDAVLLGAMAHHPNPKRILDIGTGTGIIGLMLAQRYPEAQIDLLEKDIPAFKEAKLNALNSPFDDRVHVIQGDFESIELINKYDLIVSNPPYHLEDFVSSNEKKRISRSSDALHPEIFFSKSIEHLNENGSLWFISPLPYFEICKTYVANLQHQINIIPKRNKPVNRIVSCWSEKQGKTKQEDFILRQENNIYSEAYQKLTKEFHPHY